MKHYAKIVALYLLSACTQQNDKLISLQNQVDSLQLKLNDSYKPGLGEFMGNVQVHHSKLWFAGKNQNWKLAGFEINEIKESFDDIKKYCTDRPEIKDIGMIEQPLQNITKAIEHKNLNEFINSYTVLTTTCNSCHKATNHGFNVITTPKTPPFSNQNYSLHN
ncbi:MAG: hypothetical protein JST63_13635 [Bacteroidetes bacterium]|nr:hypothetical protein [Bacteroidota bacterium]